MSRDSPQSPVQHRRRFPQRDDHRKQGSCREFSQLCTANLRRASALPGGRNAARGDCGDTDASHLGRRCQILVKPGGIGRQEPIHHRHSPVSIGAVTARHDGRRDSRAGPVARCRSGPARDCRGFRLRRKSAAVALRSASVCSCAWYELRTSGPDSTWPKPEVERDALELARTRRACSSATIGRWASDGRRYWPIVRIWQSDRAQVAQHLDDLVPRLAEADHQAGLGRDVRRPRARAVEQLERARVAAARPRRAIEPRHRLGVVVEHVGPRVEDGPQRRFVALEVRDQHFDAARRAARALIARIVSREMRRRRSPAGRRGRPR